MRKKITVLLSIGFVLGLLVGNLIAYLTSNHMFPWVSNAFSERVKSPIAAFVIQALACGAFGSACMGCMALYDIEEWPLLRATLVHYAIMIFGYVTISLLLDWNESVWGYLLVLGIMTAIFFAIWLFMYLVYKKQVRELNELNRKQRNDTEGKGHEEE